MVNLLSPNFQQFSWINLEITKEYFFSPITVFIHNLVISHLHLKKNVSKNQKWPKKILITAIQKKNVDMTIFFDLKFSKNSTLEATPAAGA